MGVSVRIAVLFLLISAAVAVPAGDSKWIPKIDGMCENFYILIFLCIIRCYNHQHINISLLDT